MSFGELTPEIMQHYKFWARVADYYDKQCTKAALAMYAQQVSRFAIEELVRAFQVYSENPKNQFMPKPGQFIAILEPQSDPDSEAKLIAARVVKAVSEHGWPNSSKAKADIGPAGWAAVEAYGGWTFICENLGLSISMGQFQAQIRGVAKAEVEKRRSGISTDRQIEHGCGESKRLKDVVSKLAIEKQI